MTGGQRELEAALARLAPQAGRLDRDRVLYEAGRAAGRGAGRRRERCWVGLAAVLAVCLAGSWAWQMGGRRAVEVGVGPGPVVQLGPVRLEGVEAVSAVPAGGGSEAGAAWGVERKLKWSGNEYLVLRERVLAEGLAALPAGSGWSEAASVRGWLPGLWQDSEGSGRGRISGGKS